MKFSDLDINPDLIKAIKDTGFTELTAIQEKCLQPSLSGKDIAGVAQTGTGKTLAYLMPLLHKIFERSDESKLSALIMAPTRELCLQIAEEATRMCKYHNIKISAIYGGEGYNRQEQQLQKLPDLIVATPGRLIDFMKQGKVNTSSMGFLILDEADRMFDMGFIRDIRFIMRKMPDGIQTMLFSATLSYYVIRLAADFMKDPEEVRIESDSVAIEKIEQQLYHLGRDEKMNYLMNLLLESAPNRAIVFTNLKTMIPVIVNSLRRYGIGALGISSHLDQRKRIRCLKDFKLGKYSVLVATDVASRGLDVDDITHIFNYDLPMDGETYVHRIGRTARAGKSGISISYCSENDYEALPRIEKYTGQKIPVQPINEDFLARPSGNFTPLKPEIFPGSISRTGSNRNFRDKNRDNGYKKRRATSPPRGGRSRDNARTYHAPDIDSSMTSTVRNADRAALLGETIPGDNKKQRNPGELKYKRPHHKKREDIKRERQHYRKRRPIAKERREKNKNYDRVDKKPPDTTGLIPRFISFFKKK